MFLIYLLRADDAECCYRSTRSREAKREFISENRTHAFVRLHVDFFSAVAPTREVPVTAGKFGGDGPQTPWLAYLGSCAPNVA
jgi:hypothetical protein